MGRLWGDLQKSAHAGEGRALWYCWEHAVIFWHFISFSDLSIQWQQTRKRAQKVKPTHAASQSLSYTSQAGSSPTQPALREDNCTNLALRPEASLLQVVETSFQKQNVCNKEGVLFHLVSFSAIGLRKHRGLGFYKPRPAVTSLSFDSLVLGRLPLFFLITEMKTELRKAS